MQSELVDAYKKKLDLCDKFDKIIQNGGEAYRRTMIYCSSHKINALQLLQKLEKAPKKALDDINASLKNTGKEPVTWEGAVELATTLLADVEKDEEKQRAGFLELFKNMLEIVENDLRSNKAQLSCSESEERYILEEVVSRNQKQKNTVQKLISEVEIEAAGRKGEKAVEYAIKWLKPEGYTSIVKDCLSKYGSVSIILKNADYIDEEQEFDHIVVGENGVFIIETKNYAGVISVSAEGDWIQEKDGVCRGIKNPVQQCRRHYGVIKSIVGDVPITSIICVANDGVIIKGRENCRLPIVKVELLQDFIMRVKAEKKLSESEIKDIVEKIQLKKKSEPLKLKRRGD